MSQYMKQGREYLSWCLIGAPIRGIWNFSDMVAENVIVDYPGRQREGGSSASRYNIPDTYGLWESPTQWHCNPSGIATLGECRANRKYLRRPSVSLSWRKLLRHHSCHLLASHRCPERQWNVRTPNFFYIKLIRDNQKQPAAIVNHNLS